MEEISQSEKDYVIHLSYISGHDTSLSAYVKVPKDTSNYPAIIILGGMMTGKSAVNYAYGVENVVLAAPDYRYKTKVNYNFFTIFADLQSAYQATFLQIVDNLLLIEFFQNWKKTKHQNLSILGYSFGVPFALATAQLENNISHLALVYGGADLLFLIQHNLNLFNNFWDNLLSYFFWIHLYNFEPNNNTNLNISTKVIVMNGLNDEKIPNKSAQVLYESIPNEKDIIWIDSKHVHPRNKKLSLKIISHLNDWYTNKNFFNTEQQD